MCSLWGRRGQQACACAVFFLVFRCGRCCASTTSRDFYAQILPGQIAGEAVKMVLLRKEEPRFERLVSVVLVDKWIGLCALLFLGCAGLWWSRPTIPFGIYVSMVVGVVLLSCSLFFFRSARVLRVFLAWMDWCKEHCWGGPLFGRLAQFASAWNEILQDLRLLGKSLLWGAVYHMLAGLFLMVLASACGLWLPWVDWLWIFSVLSLVLLLPISVGGIGVREGTLVGVLHWLGIPATLSMSFAFALLSLTLFHALLGGLWMQAGSLRKP